MTGNRKLRCTACNAAYPVAEAFPRCLKCGEPVEMELVTKGAPRDGNVLGQTILERYGDFFPFDTDGGLTLNEGFTSLVRSNVAWSDSLYLKNETQNPTWSFKDRGTIMGLLHARALGFKKVGTVSTGNMAVSVAAYGARAGLKTYVLVDSRIPDEKIAPIAVYGPKVIKVEGAYDELYSQSLEIGHREGIYFINSDVPFRIEGYKSIAFEISEQLGFDVPEYVAVPTGSGGNIRGILKGFIEFYRAGITARVPRMICCQALGGAPIVKAHEEGLSEVRKACNAETIASAIANPYPPSGNETLRKLREYDGLFVAVSDEEIVAAQKQLARDGIFGQPSSGVALACVSKLVAEKKISGGDRVVCLVTGSGLKYIKAVEKHETTVYQCMISDLEKCMHSLA